MAVVGIGRTPLKPFSPEVSYKELMFEAATRAYEDAGIDPRKDVDSFIGVSEDFWEGTSIFDEYIPDQLGGALRPVCTIGNEGLHGVAMAAMQLLTGRLGVAVVESHSKLSEVESPSRVMALALDPILNRPLGINPHAIAGLEMASCVGASEGLRRDCARVVVKNRRAALRNPYSAHPASIELEEVLASEELFSPLRQLELSAPADGAVVVVLASEERARRLKGEPIWIDGMGWANDTPTLESRDWRSARYAEWALQRASAMAGYSSTDVDLYEIDDTYAYKEIQHADSLGICRAADYRRYISSRGPPINPSGGSLGCGHLLDATGLFRLAEAVEQLRGTAGSRQVRGARRALVQSWRGVPTTSGAVLLLSSEERDGEKKPRGLNSRKGAPAERGGGTTERRPRKRAAPGGGG
ncbi:MAG: thiolase C-terminal domain-containing protein [Thermoplasmatota archaeon]